MIRHLYIIITLVMLISASLHSTAEINISGGEYVPIRLKPSQQSGLTDLFVVASTDGISLSYPEATSEVRWYKFSKLGAAYAEELSGAVMQNGFSTISVENGSMGYVAENGSTRYYVWISDYSEVPLKIDGITFSDECECDMTTLAIAGSCDALTYYSINGQRISIDREISLHYYTLEWNENRMNYEQTDVTKSIPGFSGSITTTAPLCNTTFTLSGDRFLTEWGIPQECESATYNTQAVQVQAFATRTKGSDSDSNTDGDLGGSAPAIIEFSGYRTDATIFSEWQIATDESFEDIKYRFSDDNVSFTFNESGKFFARYIGANANGTCESISEVFSIYIGESRLECPNAFSPLSDIESSRRWRVSYSSIVEFDCHIFNRYGIELFHYTDPAKSWDGTHNGKTVGTGVYFYVITARGADGKRYNMKGDINILNLKDNR